MISVFIIGIIVVITFRAVGTSHENKSAIDRFGEIIRNKPEEPKKEDKKLKCDPVGKALLLAKANSDPMLKKIRQKANTEEKIIMSEAFLIMHEKKVEIQKEEGTYEEEI